MTAIERRRARRTVTAAATAAVLVVAAVFFAAVGVITLSNSQEGEAVGIDPRPRETLPATPNALVAVTDDSGRLASVVVLTLQPDGQGGSIVTVPPNADASAGFGLQRRPLDELFDADDPVGFVAVVEDMLSITVERSTIVDPAGLQALLDPLGPAQVVLPDAVIDSDASGDVSSTTTVPDNTDPVGTDPAGTDDSEFDESDVDESDVGVEVDGVIVSAGPQIVDPEQAAEVLTAIDVSVPAYDQHPLDVAMWSAIAQLAPVADLAVVPVATDAQGLLVAPATLEDLVTQLFSGPVGVRDIAAAAPSDATNPTGADVVVLDRQDSTLVFAQISPSLVSTPNPGSKVRVEVGFTDDQLASTDGLYETNADIARAMIGLVQFVQGNAVSVDTSASGAPELTIVEVADPALLEEAITTAELLYGPAEVRAATTVLDGVDVVVTLGRSYIERAVARAANSTGASGLEPDDSTPPDTVESDG